MGTLRLILVLLVIFLPILYAFNLVKGMREDFLKKKRQYLFKEELEKISKRK